MTKFARLTLADAENTRTVLEITEAASLGDLGTRYHPTLAAEFISVPAGTVPGSTKQGAIWTHPEPAEPREVSAPPAPRRLQLSPPEFKMAFTVMERLAVKAARAYAGDDADQLQARAILDDWYDIIDDPRLTYIDLALPATIEGVEFLVTLSVLTTERCAEILAGVPA